MADSDSSFVLYKHPPITEAVIGINFSTPIKKVDFNSVNKKFHSHYPNNKIVSNFDVAVEVHNGEVGNPTANFHKKDGHRHSTVDMTQMLVLWPASFSLSQLAPYTGWDDFLARFVRDWAIWKRTVGFQQIGRIGVRYINRIDIPIRNTITKYEEFLNIYPKLPANLDPVLSYAVQVARELIDIDCLLKINSAVVSSPILDHISFVIDIDISKELDPPQSDNDICDLLNKIRVKKNEVFETCISDRARELFQ